MMGLPYGEEITIVGQTMWTQFTSVTDGQTDRQTDRIKIPKTVHGKNEYRVKLHDSIGLHSSVLSVHNSK